LKTADEGQEFVTDDPHIADIERGPVDNVAASASGGSTDAETWPVSTANIAGEG
jgi:hypothetical protein